MFVEVTVNYGRQRLGGRKFTARNRPEIRKDSKAACKDRKKVLIKWAHCSNTVTRNCKQKMWNRKIKTAMKTCNKGRERTTLKKQNYREKMEEKPVQNNKKWKESSLNQDQNS